MVLSFMSPEDEVMLHQCVETIAGILYRNTPVEQLQTLEGIEQSIRDHALEKVLPQLGIFLLQQRLQQPMATTDG